MSSDSHSFLKPLLVCPLCKEELAFNSAVISCTACGERFPQSSSDWFNLLPNRVLGSDWKKRQDEMEEWYKNLAENEDWAVHCFANDYQPFSSFLATLSGNVLDLGGGNGVVRHYLPEAVRYVTLDPSLDWLGAEWTSLAHEFPCLSTPPPFIRGVGEHLPFSAKTFDAVFAFWTLNHVSQPKQVFQEVHRVLKPNGLFLAVLEDMEPRWSDLITPAYRKKSEPHVAVVAAKKLRSLLPNQQWPLQDDHIRLQEAQLRQWSNGAFEIIQRRWVGNYLTYEFQKSASPESAI